MRNNWNIAVLAGAMLAGIGGAAQADSHVRFNVAVGVPAPAVYAPAVAYYPAPMYYPPRVVYAPPPAYYGPLVYAAPVRYYGRPYYQHRHHWR